MGIGDGRRIEEGVGLDTLALHDEETVVVRGPLSGEKNLLIQHPRLLLGLPEDHFFVEDRGAVEHEEVEGGNYGADKDDELGAQAKADGSGLVHEIFRVSAGKAPAKVFSQSDTVLSLAATKR